MMPRCLQSNECSITRNQDIWNFPGVRANVALLMRTGGGGVTNHVLLRLLASCKLKQCGVLLCFVLQNLDTALWCCSGTYGFVEKVQLEHSEHKCQANKHILVPHTFFYSLSCLHVARMHRMLCVCYPCCRCHCSCFALALHGPSHFPSSQHSGVFVA